MVGGLSWLWATRLHQFLVGVNEHNAVMFGLQLLPFFRRKLPEHGRLPIARERRYGRVRLGVSVPVKPVGNAKCEYAA